MSRAVPWLCLGLPALLVGCDEELGQVEGRGSPFMLAHDDQSGIDDPLPLSDVEIPAPSGGDIVDPAAAVLLGKALFWDMQGGGDGLTACASCHFTAGADNRRLNTVNPGATRIVRLPLSVYRGKRLDEIGGLGAFSQAVWQRFELHAASPEAGERDHWQDSFELNTIGPDGRVRESITLLVRGAAMPHGARLMVFDDITELVSAQRSEAWSEVARRLAHEIKNPLTPIQLSAERIEHKLGPKLEGADQAMLARSVATIVNQVQSMNALVN